MLKNWIILLAILLTVNYTTADETTFSLRTMGDITLHERGSGEGKASWTTLATESGEAAGICASKLYADLTGFGNVRPLELPGLSGTFLTLDRAGFWQIALNGNKVEFLYGADEAKLRALIKQAAGENWKPVTPGSHPRRLDRFDNDAFAIGLLGWGKLPPDYRKGVHYLKENKFNFIGDVLNWNIQLAPGLYDFSVVDWFAALAERNGTAWQIYQPWGNPERPAHLWNKTPLPHVHSEKNFVSHPDLDYQKLAVYAEFEPNRSTDADYASSLRGIARHLAGKPAFNNHFGAAEIGHNVLLSIPVYSADPAARAAYAEFLGKPGTEEAIPTMELFAGWNPEQCLDLRGDWQLKADPDPKATVPGDGGNSWSPIRSDDPLILTFENYPGSLWLGRKFEVRPGAREKLRYLHISRNAWHGRVSQVLAVFLNGRELKDLTRRDPVTGDFDECFETGDALKDGINHIVLKLDGKPIPGYLFLGPAGRWQYPSADPALNKQYFDTVEFASLYRMQGVENQLKATRSGDPQGSPLLLMATWEFIDKSFELCRRYGATAQDTGQGGACWAPWLARYYTTRGLPITCEPGNAPGSAREMRKIMTLYMLLGNEGFNLLFDPEQYMGNEEVRRWIEENAEVIRSAGKFEMTAPDIGVMRSVRNASRLHFPAVWSWDVSRGELQAAGRTINLADPSDFEHDRAGKYFRVVFDAATELLTEGEVDGIERFVRNGGTFIAMHETGKHSPERAWSWPISRLTGLKVLKSGEGRWGKIRFSDRQQLWPELRGRELDGWGLACDWKNDDVTGKSLGLETAGDDVEVVAEWVGKEPGEGNVAIAVRKLGKGQVITLGSTFWRNGRDRNGRFEADPAARPYLAELLDSLQVPRHSWNDGRKGTSDIFTERHLSKNGLYDIYVAAKVNDHEGAENVTLTFSAPGTPETLRELTAAGHPEVKFSYEKGKLTLGGLSFEPMQIRIFAAPRQDISNAAVHWLKSLEQRWYRLPEIPQAELPPEETLPGNILPLSEGWTMLAGGPAWGGEPSREDWDKGRQVKLGAYLTMGLENEEEMTHFRKEFTIPPEWKGKRVALVFASQYWFYGIGPRGRLWINGKSAPAEQPFGDRANGSFALDLPDSGNLILELEIDGALQRKGQLRSRPSGVTGTFFAEANPQPLKREAIAQWSYAGEVNRLKPLDTAAPPRRFLYLECSIDTPKGPSGKIYLESPVQLGWLMINSHVISTPGWMRRLDVSNLLRKDGGRNVIRYWPQLCKEKPLFNRYLEQIPPLEFTWYPE